MLRYGLSLLVLLCSIAPSLAQTNPEKFVDHYACYFIVEPVEFTGPPTLKLIDQFYFSPPAPAPLTQRELLCNPVMKDGSRIQFKEVHLVCYGLQQDNAEEYKLAVSNQFGSAELTTRVDRTFCVPSGKSKQVNIIPPDPEAPRRVDHFKCYSPNQSPEIGRRVRLDDQFNKALFATVGEAVFLCNPTEKVIEGEQKGPLLHNTAHLVCYQLIKQNFAREKAPHFNWPDVTVVIRNQFEIKELKVKTEPVVLCVPSTKTVLSRPKK
jgi:hypothetical protein